MESKSDVRTFAFSELRTYQPPTETNNLISEGILRDDAILAVVGPAKSFKSFMLNTLCTDLVTGRNLFGALRGNHGRQPLKAFEIEKPCKVLFVEQEVGARDLKERLLPIYNSLNPDEKLLMDTGFYSHSLDHRIQLDDQAGVLRLHQIVAKIRPDVLVLDPLIEFHTSNENDTQSMNKLMRQFDRLRETYSPLAIVFSHHEGLPSTTNPRQGIRRFRGNTVVGGKVDGAILISVHNQRARTIRADFVLRRDKPLDSLFLQIDENLRGRFLCWYRDAERKKKVGKADAEDLGNPEISEGLLLQ